MMLVACLLDDTLAAMWCVGEVGQGAVMDLRQLILIAMTAASVAAATGTANVSSDRQLNLIPRPGCRESR